MMYITYIYYFSSFRLLRRKTLLHPRTVAPPSNHLSRRASRQGPREDKAAQQPDRSQIARDEPRLSESDGASIQAWILERGQVTTFHHKIPSFCNSPSSQHSELMVYDWTTEGDVETVVEDIERLDFTPSTDRDKKKWWDWTFENEEEYALARSK